MNKVWKILPQDSKLSREISISSILASLLSNRNIKTPDEAYSFLNPTLEGLHNPVQLKGVEKAAVRIKHAVSEKEKILICGDYDADGLTATALLTLVIEDMGAFVESHIPHRVNDGYGLNDTAIYKAQKNGCKLILTVDCGINAVSQIKLARKLGIDVIVTDHHEVEVPSLPPAIAIINPHQKDCFYPYKHLAGVGVAFKLAQQLQGLQKIKNHLDLVALGTVADIVPLTGENRALVNYGLREIAKTSKPGIKALLQVTNCTRPDISATDISFMLAPRINAPGRLDLSTPALKLLITKSQEEALSLAYELEKVNRKRKNIQKKIFRQAIDKIKNSESGKLPAVIVLSDDNWHPGIIGIVASKIVQSYYHPAILVAMGKKNGMGSARSINNFHMLDALRECRNYLSNFGGHEKAAGLTVQREDFQSFSSAMDETGKRHLNEQDFLPVLNIDMEIELTQIDSNLLNDIAKLDPFGCENKMPLFVSRNVQAVHPRLVGKSHLKMQVVKNGKCIDAIAFGMGSQTQKIDDNRTIDIVYSIQKNHWKGQDETQLRIEDLKILPSGGNLL